MESRYNCEGVLYEKVMARFDAKGESPLMIACRLGDAVVVRALLRAVSGLPDEKGRTM